MIELDLVEREHVLTIERHGHTIACCDYSWVMTYADMLNADCGAPYQHGPVLYVANIVNRGTRKDLMALRHKLPTAKWIVGLTEDWQLKAPKGVPPWFGSSLG